MEKYTEEMRNECIKKHLEGRTVKSISTEYGLGQGTLKYWLKQYYKNETPEKREEDAQYRKLLKEVEELRKENSFLKEVSSYFASHPKK